MTLKIAYLSQKSLGVTYIFQFSVYIVYFNTCCMVLIAWSVLNYARRGIHVSNNYLLFSLNYQILGKADRLTRNTLTCPGKHFDRTDASITIFLHEDSVQIRICYIFLIFFFTYTMCFSTASIIFLLIKRAGWSWPF